MVPEFLSTFANHLWQSTFFASVVTLLALVLRKNQAQLRYRLWLASSIKFLVPFTLLVSAGARFTWPMAARVTQPLSQAIGQLSQFSHPFALPPVADPVTLPAGGASNPLPILLLGLWLVGFVAALARWWFRWRGVCKSLRNASRLAIDAPIPVMTSRTPLEPGIFGVFRPVLLLPEGIAERLTPAQLKAILAHEFCHVRRRDNLAGAIHMVVEAVFWFHPLVWWIGARLVEERERACDEEVLRKGSEPEVYAAGILQVCRYYLKSPVVCASGVTGADLKKRIEAIMTHRVQPSLTPVRKFLLATVAVAAVAMPVTIGIVDASQGRPETQSGIKFEVATIKPSRAGGGRGGLAFMPGGGLRMTGVSLTSLIAFAYDVRENQIAGGPKWMGSEYFDLLAKPEHPGPGDDEAATAVPGSTGWDRVRLRTQALLAERFRLVFHRDNKNVAVYELVIVKNGPKLQPSKEGDQGNFRALRSRDQIELHRASMPILATMLAQMVGRPVVDRTGLQGTFDGKLEYAPDGPQGEVPPEGTASDTARPSVFTALREQFGLKLEAAKGLLETFVVDRVERPSAN